MVLTSILRNSASYVLPTAVRLLRARSNYRVSLFTAINRAPASTLSPDFIARSWSIPSYTHYSSSTAREKPDTDADLIRVLQCEIYSAEEIIYTAADENIPSELPFEIEDLPGQQTVILKRSYEGDNISVEVYMPDLGTDEDDDDDADENSESPHQSSVPLMVTIAKKSGKGPVLEFSVTAYPNEISIDSFSVKNPDAAEEIAYEGPDFQDLDENLQKALHKYLAVRGIRPSTTSFLHEYMKEKDNREYLVWLKKVKGFIEA